LTLSEIAKSITARSLRHHPARDNHEWSIRRLTVLDAGDVLEQPITRYEDERIYPVISQINEYEAANIGQNVRAGDLKLIVDGYAEIDDTTMLICDGQKVDVYRSPAEFYDSNVIQRTVYVRRPPERTDV
jgi:hypothetical protein